MNNDLISRSALMAEMMKDCPPIHGEHDPRGGNGGFISGRDFEKMKEIMKYTEMVDKQPAVDAEPVRHGALVEVNHTDWCGGDGNVIDTTVEEKCSRCRRYVERYSTSPKENYCPNCGAKMDLEVDDE